MNHISDQEMRALTNQASGGPWEARENDAEFIAAARQWIPDALNRLNQIRALIDPTKATPGSTAHKILQTLNNTQNQPTSKEH